MAARTGATFYPPARLAPETSTEYNPVEPQNPVLAGAALGIASKFIYSFPPIQTLFYYNANFHGLRKLDKEGGVLRDYEWRWDPTVIPAPMEGFNGEPGPIEEEPGRKSVQHYWSARDFVAAYTVGTITPLQVADKVIELIENDEIHKIAFVFVEKESLLAAAKESTERYKAGKPIPGGLDGVLFAVKDEVGTKGSPLMMGTDTVQDIPQENAWCVEKLLEKGALLVGKTNMHEIGLDTINNNIHHGTPRNPYNAGYYCGGSSGGSGYVLGAGLVPIAVGCDGGGSIRIPSAYNGAYGLKPSAGRISLAPTVSIAPSVGVVGPMAATLADLELAYTVMAQPNPSDSHSASFPPPVTHPSPSTGRKRIIGIFKPWVENCDPEVRSHLHTAIDHLRSADYTIVEITLPLLPLAQLAHAMTILTEISAATFNPKTNFSHANKVLLGVIKQTPHSDVILAQKVRNMLMMHLAALFKAHPGLLILSPTTPFAGVKIGHESHAVKGGYGVSDANTSLASMRYVFLANLCGLPSLSLPVGYLDEEHGGLPVSMMCAAEWGCEEECFEFGRALDGFLERKRAKKWENMMAV